MTISSTISKVTVAGNSSATSFSFSPMVVLQSSDLAVFIRDAAGIETELIETVDYTVVVASYPGTGSITYTGGGTPLPTGASITMARQVPLTQAVALQNQGGYLPAVQEGEFDKLTMMGQQFQEQLDRCLKLSITDPGDVANIGGYLADVAAIASDVTAVGAIAAHVTTVAGIAANVTTVAGIAAAVTSVAAVATDVSSAVLQNFRFAFETSTSMAAPATGAFRLNNATVASATAIAFNAASADTGNPDISDWVATWGASTNTVKGTITLRKVGTPSTFATYSITAAVSDNSTWLQATVSAVAHNGTFSAADLVTMQFTRAGDAGISGTGSGTVTSVALAIPAILAQSGGPITSSGTITLTLATQAKNLVWSGPASGSDTTPSFRSLVGADLPAPTTSVLGGVKAIAAVSHKWIASIDTAGLPALTQPAYSDLSGTVPAVTSIGIAVPAALLTVSGSPVTVSGTITLALATQTQNKFLAGPISGAAATPTFRVIDTADLPSGIGGPMFAFAGQTAERML